MPRYALAAAIVAALAAPTADRAAAAAREDAIALPELEVTGAADEIEPPSSATRLSLAPRQTPQSLSLLTREQLDEFRLTDINDALQTTTGVTVEQVETDRTYYTARGFDITNFQYDGIGLPLPYGVIDGDLDTAFYERIEVVRGATGLVSGTGDPSATVNFVRKRPTADLQAQVALTAGSWDLLRAEADVAGPLADRVRGRVVLAHQDADSYLDRYRHAKSLFYGVIEADLSDSTLLTLGHSRQENDADSPLWGALPLHDTAGNAFELPRSTSTAADWSYWDGDHADTFIELRQAFASDWELRAIASRKSFDERSKLFYVYGVPDPTTPGSDLFAYPSRYDSQTDQTLVDLFASGPFELAGRTHQLMVGAGWAKSELDDVSHYGQGIGTEIPPLDQFDGNYPEPAFDAGVAGSDFEDRQASVYAAARFSLTEQLSAVLGSRVTDVDSEGTSYGRDRTTSYDAEVIPYAGVVFDVAPQHSLYASYTEIFKPQVEVDIDRNRLAPVEGSNLEAGIKSDWFDGQLHTAFALFRTEQDGLAEPAGTIPGTADPYFRPVEGLTSRGAEIDVVGYVGEHLRLTGGYTWLDLEDADGTAARTFIPRRLLRTSASYQLPALPALTLGASIQWQGDIHAFNGPIRIEQDAYTLVKLMAGYEFSDRFSATLNIDNATDEKYIASLYWASFGQGFYGAPANASLTLRWRY